MGRPQAETFPFEDVADLLTSIRALRFVHFAEMHEGRTYYLVSIWVSAVKAPLKLMWSRISFEEKKEAVAELKRVEEAVEGAVKHRQMRAVNLPGFTSPLIPTISRIVCTCDAQNPLLIFTALLESMFDPRGVPQQEQQVAVYWSEELGRKKERIDSGWNMMTLAQKKEVLTKWLVLLTTVDETQPAARRAESMLPAFNDLTYFPATLSSLHHSSTSMHPAMHSLAHGRRFKATLERAQLTHRQAKIYGRW